MKKTDWNTAKAALKPALLEHYDDAENEINAGREMLFDTGDCYLLLRVEQQGHHRELVVVGLAGNIKSGTFAAVGFGVLTQCDSLRCHTFRPRAKLRFFKSLNMPVFEAGEDGNGHTIIRMFYHGR